MQKNVAQGGPKWRKSILGLRLWLAGWPWRGDPFEKKMAPKY